MTAANQTGWTRRLVLSVVYTVIAVFPSTVIVIILASLEGAVEQRSSGIDIAAYVLGFPLATGWVSVMLIFGEWPAVHGGQIALVPLLSIVIDSLLVFLVWEFWHRKATRALDSGSTLGLNG